jgi:hypothetical protein
VEIKLIQLLSIAIFSLAYGNSPTENAYVLILGTIPISFIFSSKVRKKHEKYTCTYHGNKVVSKLVTWLPFLIMCSWLYGAFVGLLLAVPVENIFRNFFGLLAYVWFYSLLLLRPSSRDLIVAVFIAGAVQIFYGLTASIDVLSNPSIILEGASISDARSLYSAGFLILFPLVSIGLASYTSKQHIGSASIFGKSKPNLLMLCKNPAMLILFSYTLIVPSFSKGFILGFFILF